MGPRCGPLPLPRRRFGFRQIFDTVDISEGRLNSAAEISDVDYAIMPLGSLARPGDELRLVFRRFDRSAGVGHQYMPLAAAPDHLVDLHGLHYPSRGCTVARSMSAPRLTFRRTECDTATDIGYMREDGAYAAVRIFDWSGAGTIADQTARARRADRPRAD